MRRSPSTAARDRKTVLSDDAGVRSDATCQRSPNKFGEAVSGGAPKEAKGVCRGKGRGTRQSLRDEYKVRIMQNPGTFKYA